MLDSISSIAQQFPNALFGSGESAGATSASGGLLGGLLGDGIGDMLSLGGLGSMAESLLDGLGAPDWAGDLAKMFCAAASGDVAGAVGGYLDAMEDAFVDIGFPEVGSYVKTAADLTSSFGGAAGGDPSAASSIDVETIASLFGDTTSADTNALAALVGALNSDTTGSAAGSVRL